MLLVLLLGIAVRFLAEEGRCVFSIELTTRTVLRLGVALLGMAGAGTILFGIVGAWLLGRGWRLALLNGGSVAICGASAAIAIAALLPKNQSSERNLIFTVMGVAVLSTIAMIAYPIIVDRFGLDRAAGIFLGGTIHDAAQVVGAAFFVSQANGETSKLVK